MLRRIELLVKTNEVVGRKFKSPISGRGSQERRTLIKSLEELESRECGILADLLVAGSGNGEMLWQSPRRASRRDVLIPMKNW